MRWFYRWRLRVWREKLRRLEIALEAKQTKGSSYRWQDKDIQHAIADAFERIALLSWSEKQTKLPAARAVQK